MKKIAKIFAVLTLFNIAFSSCKQDQYDIAKQNLVVSHSADGPIAQAEAKLGTLEKRDVTFTDKTGKSSFKMRFAAKTQKLIDQYLNENTIEFFTLTKGEALTQYGISSAREEKEEKNESIDSDLNQYNSNEVFTELIDKKLEKQKQAYGLTISYKSLNSVKNAKPNDEYDNGYYWRSSPIEWIEKFKVTTTNITTATTDPHLNGNWFTSRKRGWCCGWSFWTSYGQFSKYYNSPEYNVDGPKWFSIGVTPSSNRYYFSATFIDLESGQSPTSQN